MSENSAAIQPRLGLSAEERANIFALYAILTVATLFGFIGSVVLGRSSPILFGLCIAAFVLGLRHGVDADHIVAIDNTTRKLMHDGKRSFTVGTWFSLGHSTVVVGLTVALVLATQAIVEGNSFLHSAGSLIGTAVSGTFLFLIGAVNLLIVVGVYRVFQNLRRGDLDEAELDKLLENRGFLNRYFKGLFRIVREPWQIYPIGLLFGLGFDTASEILLFALAVGFGVTSPFPIYWVLILPVMFTLGMVIVDTTDGVTMCVAYGWAFVKPLRKIYYNLTITIISVLVAFVIGGVELLQVLSGQLNLQGAFWSWLAALDFETIGYGIIGIFVLSWLGSMAFWKFKHFDEEVRRQKVQF
ncbi:HoxN/HupN/NixA family nickel/cobalt transporter [Candidatus Bathyarchaeota archaeon]|nr:HoxN/HupN/NixA family nickel/cobalt transporter [Candidatus Bathyarchaeota archaeon]